jgi:hypothetical protein
MRDGIAEFFDSELDRIDDRAPVKIELVYSPPGFNREPLRIWHVKDAKDAWAFDKTPAHRNKLITAIMDLATQRSDTEGGATRRMFRLIVHPGAGERMSHAFSVLPNYDGPDAELAREDAVEATPGGTLGQVLKQNRDLHKSILKRAAQDERLIGGIAQLVTSLTKHQSEHQSHLWDRIEQLEDQRVKQIELVEEAKTMSHDRMIEAKVVTSEQERKDKGLEMFEVIGKAIVSHLTHGKMGGGGKVDIVNGPPELAQLPALLSDFMASLSQAQRDELLERLPMEHKLALGEIQRCALGGDVSGTYRAVASFMSKLDDSTGEMLDDVLTGKQHKLLERIFDLVRDTPPPPGTNGAHVTQAAVS